MQQRDREKIFLSDSTHRKSRYVCYKGVDRKGADQLTHRNLYWEGTHDTHPASRWWQQV